MTTTLTAAAVGLAGYLFCRPARRVSRPSHTPTLGPTWLVGPAAVGLCWVSPTLAAVALTMAGFGLAGGRRVRARRQRSERLEALIGLVDSLGQQVRAGHATNTAMISELREAVDGPLAEWAGAVLGAVEAGVSHEVALARASDAVNDRDLDLVLATLTVLSGHGGPAGPALDRLGDSLRDRRRTQAELVAQAATATASAALLSALPVLFAGGLALVDADLRRFYLHDSLGAVVVMTALGLTGLGWLWMDRLIWTDR